MKNDAVPVEIRGLLPTSSGWAVFLGNDEKIFVIQIEQGMALVIENFRQAKLKERPLTHDLMVNVFLGFGITLERVVITELRNSTYFARMILQQTNELGRKMVELDARPSDCLALAVAQKKPIYVACSLFDNVDDMSHLLEQINESDDNE